MILFCAQQINPVLQSLRSRCVATQKISCSENSQENMHSLSPKAYYPAIKEMLTIPAFSFLSDNTTVFTYKRH